jgi:hypothetical protein
MHWHAPSTPTQAEVPEHVPRQSGAVAEAHAGSGVVQPHVPELFEQTCPTGHVPPQTGALADAHAGTGVVQPQVPLLSVHS